MRGGIFHFTKNRTVSTEYRKGRSKYSEGHGSRAPASSFSMPVEGVVLSRTPAVIGEAKGNL